MDEYFFQSEASNREKTDIPSLFRLPDSDNSYKTVRNSLTLVPTNTALTSQNSILPNESSDNGIWTRMFPTELIGNTFLEMVASTEVEVIKEGRLETGIKTNGATLVMNSSVNATESTLVPELFYRHSAAMTVVYCVAYILVFAVGLVGNCFVIAVVFRSPRMRTVTNFFIVNLAVADILVIVFCLPATLTSNIFVRKLF